jgi:hypothetical protein
MQDMTIRTPLLVATIGGHAFRFFRPPDNVPDLPWHAIDDLHRCLGLNRDGRRLFLRKLRSAEWSTTLRTIATADGVVTIAPHYMAKGTISAMVSEGDAPSNIRDEYDDAATDAIKELMKPFPFASDAWFNYMRAAMHRYDDDPSAA